MTLELYEIICEELRQRKVNSIVSSILIDLCKQQLDKVSYSRGAFRQRYVSEESKDNFEVQESARVREITRIQEPARVQDTKPPAPPLDIPKKVKETVDFNGVSKVYQDAPMGSKPKGGGIGGGEEVTVSDENLDMLSKMFG